MHKRLRTELLFYCIRATFWRSDHIWVISFACGDKNQGCRESYTTFLLFILYQKINKFKVETDNFPHPRVPKWYYCWRCRHKDNRIALRFRQSGGLRIPVCLHFPGRLRAHSQAELPSERKSL